MNQNTGFKTISLFTQPYLDTYNKCYKNIVTVNLPPQGPLQNLIRRIKLNPLSPFKQAGPCNPIQKCDFALMSLDILGYGSRNSCGSNLMSPDEIPNLFSYLLSTGYTIDTKITNMLNKSDVRFQTNDSKTLVCVITYTGN
jgi:hypothetical protein